VQSTYGETILPALVRIISQRESPARLIAYTSSAIVNYMDDLEGVPSSLQSYAAPLMNGLLAVIDTYSMRDDARMRAMSALSALVAGLGEAKLLTNQVYQNAMSIMWPFVDGQAEADLKARALDCTTVIGERNILALSIL
jgi:hypothetical protein